MRVRRLLDPSLRHRLLANGCPMPSEYPDEPQLDLKIEVSRPELTIAYDRRAGTEYVFGLRITNCTFSRLELREYHARLEWKARLCWLGDPRVGTPGKKVYQLESGLEFPCEDVLNHRLGEQGVLKPDESVQGILLAHTMFERIPFDYIHGSTAPARLSVIDQYGRRHSSLIEFSINRRATMRPWVSRPRGMGVFDGLELQSRSVAAPAVRHADESTERVIRVRNRNLE